MVHLISLLWCNYITMIMDVCSCFFFVDGNISTALKVLLRLVCRLKDKYHPTNLVAVIERLVINNRYLDKGTANCGFFCAVIPCHFISYNLDVVDLDLVFLESLIIWFSHLYFSFLYLTCFVSFSNYDLAGEMRMQGLLQRKFYLICRVEH